jgi:amidase
MVLHHKTAKPSNALITSLFVFFSSFIFAADHHVIKKTDIIDLSASEQVELILNQQITSERLVSTYLERIAALDRKGPSVQAIISINPNAIQVAKERDVQLKNGKIMGRLHGIPIIVKDNIETSELPTTAGSLALIRNDTGRDAPIIARLKAEGAIILAKANLSEWANFRDNDSISGWSAVGGQTRNPHSLDRSPCGSSSGSGAAIAAQFAPLAIGTETNGSIICPSTMNGIVGVKPTVGLLSRTHIVPISVTQDTAGPMTRSVKDAALMLSIMAGTDSADTATAHADEMKKDYSLGLNESIKGKRIGVLRAVQSEHPEIISAFNAAIESLKLQGVEFVEIDTLEMPDGFWDKTLPLLLSEFKHEINNYLSSTPKTVRNRNLQQLIAFNNTNQRQLALFGQSLFEQALNTTGYDEEYLQNRQFLLKATREDGIDRLLQENDVDALIFPSQTPAFLIDPIYGDSFPGGFAGAGWLAAISGYPHVSVPMGKMKGLPIGLSFVSGKYQEMLLLNLAYQYEQLSQKLFKPSLAPSAYQHVELEAAMKPYSLN